MPVVWMRTSEKHRTRFHRTPDCTHLTRPPSRGEHQPLIAVDLEDVGVRPCRICYPDAPRIEIKKVWCSTCKSKRPCRHNGGVRVVRRGHGLPQYVWPDTNQMPFYRNPSDAPGPSCAACVSCIQAYL